MVSEIRLYFEGDSTLREGFRFFFQELIETARQQRCKFVLIATKGTPFRDYLKGIKSHSEALNLLLLDSDTPGEAGTTEELCQAKGIDPQYEGQVFWMVPLMEAWFLADAFCLAHYYGEHFSVNALPRNPRIELIAKQDVLNTLNLLLGTRGKVNTIRQNMRQHCSGLWIPTKSKLRLRIANACSMKSENSLHSNVLLPIPASRC